MRELRIIRGVLPVLGKRNWIAYFNRFRINFHIDFERAKKSQIFVVECGDRLWAKRYELAVARTRTNVKTMVKKVEFDVEYVVVIGDRPGGQATWGDVQGHIPPMIFSRRK